MKKHRLNPITRVAQLLEGLAKKIDSDEDAEQELYAAAWALTSLVTTVWLIAQNDGLMYSKGGADFDISS